MSNNRDEDDFDREYGIFGEDCAGICSALGEMGRVSAKPVQHGVVVTVQCGHCCSDVTIGIEYANFVAIKYGVQPHVAFQGTPWLQNPLAWNLAPGMGWYPIFQCPRCGGQPRPEFPTDHTSKIYFSRKESEAFLESARANGWLPQQLEQQMSERAHAVAGQLQAQQGARR